MSSRRSEAREKAAQLHKQQEAAARRRRVTTITSVAVVAIVVVIGLVALALRGGSSGGDASITAKGPSGLVDNAIVSGQASAPVTLTLYEDLQCPSCKAFEASTGATVDQLREAGTIKVESRPLAFLDRQSTTNYSSRALSALTCVQDTAPDTVPAYKKALFAQQPKEGSAGLPDDQLVSIGKDAGAGDIGTCVKDKPFADWIKQSTTQDLKTITGTPTVLVNGKKLDDISPAGLEAAVKAADPNASLPPVPSSSGPSTESTPAPSASP